MVHRLARSPVLPCGRPRSLADKQIHFDIDGTLTGLPNQTVTYPYKFNDWDGICTADAIDTLRFSRGVVCDADHPVRRLFIDRVNPEEMDGIRIGMKKSDTATNNSAYGGLSWDRYAEEGVMWDGPGCDDFRHAQTATLYWNHSNPCSSSSWCVRDARGYLQSHNWIFGHREENTCGLYGGYSQASSTVKGILAMRSPSSGNIQSTGTSNSFLFFPNADGTTSLKSQHQGGRWLSAGSWQSKRDFSDKSCDAAGDVSWQTTGCARSCSTAYLEMGETLLTFVTLTSDIPRPNLTVHQKFYVEETGETTWNGNKIVTIRSAVPHLSNHYMQYWKMSSSGNQYNQLTRLHPGLAGAMRIEMDMHPTSPSDWGGRCTTAAHMDFVNFRDAGDGYGWAVALPVNREYYFDYEYSIDYQTMRLEFTDPFYINFYSAPHEGMLLKIPYIDYRWRFGVTHEATAAALPWYDRMFENCGGSDGLNCTGHHPVGYPGSRGPLTRFDDFGTGYMIRSDESMRTTGTTGEFWLAMNPMAGPSTAASISANAARHTVSVTPFQCAPMMSCWDGPLLTGDAGGTFYWSDIELWQALFLADSFLDYEVVSTEALPIEGASVDIPPNYHIIMDVSPPKLAKLVVRGNLTFDDSADRTLIAERILVTGMLQVGTPEAPFEHSAKILLEGDRLSDTLVVGEGVFLGNKVLAVFGELSLHGVHRATSWSRLALTATAGDSSITVATDVDWQAGDEIVFTQTTYGRKSTEAYTITAIGGADNHTIHLDRPVNETHVVRWLADMTFAPAVGLVSRSIVFGGTEDNDNRTLCNTERCPALYGAHIFVGADPQDENNLGTFDIAGVEFRRCGKINSEHPCIRADFPGTRGVRYTEAFSWFDTGGLGAVAPSGSTIRDSSFRQLFHYAFKGAGVPGMQFRNNVISRGFSGALDLDRFSDFATVTNNMIAGVWRQPIDDHTGYCTSDSSCTVEPFSAVSIWANQIESVADNLIAGSEDTGFTMRGHDRCRQVDGGDPPAGRFVNNEVVATQIGLNLLDTDAVPERGAQDNDQCIAVHRFAAWRCTHMGIMSVDQALNVEMHRVTLLENHIGFNVNYYRMGWDGHTRVENSLIAGSFERDSCDASLQCFAQSQGDVVGRTCGSMYGAGVQHVGIALPHYNNQPKTCGSNGGSEVCRPITRLMLQCGSPWEKRYGKEVARHTKFTITNTTFHGFRQAACGANPGRRSRAIALLPDQMAQVPELFMSDITWSATDSKFSLSYDTSIRTDSACETLCDAIDNTVIHDLDGSAHGSYYPQTLVSGRNAGLAEPGECVFDQGTRSFACPASNHALRKVLFEPGKKIGPITLKRISQRGYSIQHSSKGNRDEECPKEKKDARYPFYLKPDNHFNITACGTPSADAGRITWLGEAGDAVLVSINMPYAEGFHLYMDGYAPGSLERSSRQLSGGALPTLSSPRGTYSFEPNSGWLHMVMHGADGSPQKYEWKSAKKEKATVLFTVRLSVQFDRPIVGSGPGGQPTAADVAAADEANQRAVQRFTNSLVLNIARFLQIDHTRIKTVQAGGRRVRRTSGSNGTEIGFEIDPPNANVTAEDDGQGNVIINASAMEENDAFTAATQEAITSLVTSGEIDDLVSNATDSTAENGTSVLTAASNGASVETPDAEVQMAEGVDGRVVALTSLSGLVYHDDDRNGAFDEESTDWPIQSALITITDNTSEILQTVTSGADGRWTAIVEVGKEITVTLANSSLPNELRTSHRLSGAENPYTFDVEEGMAIVQHGYSPVATVSGRVVDAQSQAGLGGVIVSIQDDRASSHEVTTALDGTWSIALAGSSQLVDVDESTLPYLQPYTWGAATENEPASYTSGDGELVTSYHPLAVLSGTVEVNVAALSTAPDYSETTVDIVVDASGLGMPVPATVAADGSWSVYVPSGVWLTVTTTIFSGACGYDCGGLSVLQATQAGALTTVFNLTMPPTTAPTPPTAPPAVATGGYTSVFTFPEVDFTTLTAPQKASIVGTVTAEVHARVGNDKVFTVTLSQGSVVVTVRFQTTQADADALSTALISNPITTTIVINGVTVSLSSITVATTTPPAAGAGTSDAGTSDSVIAASVSVAIVLLVVIAVAIVVHLRKKSARGTRSEIEPSLADSGKPLGSSSPEETSYALGSATEETSFSVGSVPEVTCNEVMAASIAPVVRSTVVEENSFPLGSAPEGNDALGTAPDEHTNEVAASGRGNTDPLDSPSGELDGYAELDPTGELSRTSTLMMDPELGLRFKSMHRSNPLSSHGDSADEDSAEGTEHQQAETPEMVSKAPGRPSMTFKEEEGMLETAVSPPSNLSPSLLRRRSSLV